MCVCVCVCVCVSVSACVCVSDPRFIQFTLGSCYAVHINALSIIMKVYIERNNIKLN